jgi:hypothetical protein
VALLAAEKGKSSLKNDKFLGVADRVWNGIFWLFLTPVNCSKTFLCHDQVFDNVAMI